MRLYMGRRGEGRYRTTTTSLYPFVAHAAGIISDGGAVGLHTGGHVTAVGARFLHPTAAAGGIVFSASAFGRWAGLLGGGRRRGHHGLVQLSQLVWLLYLLLLLLLLHLLQLPGREEANDPPVGTTSHGGSAQSRTADTGTVGDARDDGDHPPTATGGGCPLEGLPGGVCSSSVRCSTRGGSSSSSGSGSGSSTGTITSSLATCYGCGCCWLSTSHVPGEIGPGRRGRTRPPVVSRTVPATRATSSSSRSLLLLLLLLLLLRLGRRGQSLLQGRRGRQVGSRG